ncbi:AAA-like domain-containing protein [bacterium]|nr:AAA-like domain-containing protein [bacterium]
MKDLANNLSKPKREFCVGGPIPKEGYYALRDRPEIGRIIDKIEKGRYFVIYAARQTGKTSLIQEVAEKLKDDDRHLPLYLTFQDFPDSLDEEEFYQQLSEMFLFEISIGLEEKGKDYEILEYECHSQQSLVKLLQNLHQQIPYHLCMFIDEFEGIPQKVLDGFLHTLRAIYLRKQRNERYNILHSIGVIGVRSISQMTFARTSSPFNIHESISISNFTTEQVRELLMQYADETREVFPEEVIEFIADKTGGQPYLVNLVAQILTEEVKPYSENRSITLSDMETAYMKMLTMRGNTNLDSIRRRIGETNNRRKLMSIITRGDVRYNLNDEVLEELITFGIIREKNGYCVISNPAYAHTIIYSYMTWNNGTSEEFFPEGYRPVIDADGFVKPHQVIENFQYFLPKVDPKFYFPEETPLEIVPHYFLLGQFDILAYHVGGHARAEVHQGHKRMDIVVFEKEGKKTVIECKIWRGPAYQDDAREQLVDYLVHENLSSGYLVFFNHKQDASYSFSKADVFGKTVYEYIIPLPERLSHEIK